MAFILYCVYNSNTKSITIGDNGNRSSPIVEAAVVAIDGNYVFSITTK